MRTRIVKWGNSLGLRIPKSFAAEVRIAEGATVELTLADGRLVITPAPPEYDLADLLDGVTDANLHAEVDTGGPVGGEAW